MTLTIDEFLAALDEHDERIPLDELTDLMHRLDLRARDVEQCIRFNEQRYQRNLLRAGDAYQALVLCWLPGQRSPIHDHKGSSCGVRVLEGKATEVRYSLLPDGRVEPTGQRRCLTAGQICGSQDADIHEMSNLEPPPQRLVTLHIYSPALLTMNTYSPSRPLVQPYEDPVVPPPTTTPPVPSAPNRTSA